MLFADGVAYVGALLDELEPAAVDTFGPDGFTSHPDYITVHRWVIGAVPHP